MTSVNPDEIQRIRVHTVKSLTKSAMAFLVISAMILSGAIVSVAGEIAFRCKVNNEYDLTDDGQLVKPKKYLYTGSSFSVERSTGRIIGGAFGNKGDYQVKVLEGDLFFKVFSFAEIRNVGEYLIIRKDQGSFVGIDYLQTVVTGICD